VELAQELRLALPQPLADRSQAKAFHLKNAAAYEEYASDLSVQAAYSLVGGVLTSMISSLIPQVNVGEMSKRNKVVSAALNNEARERDRAAAEEVPDDMGETKLHIEAGGRMVSTIGMRDLGRGREMDGIFRAKYMSGADALAAARRIGGM